MSIEILYKEMADKYASSYGDDNIIDMGDAKVNLFPIRKWSFFDGLKAALNIKDTSDKNLEPILYKLKDLGVIKSWYYNGTYHVC